MIGAAGRAFRLEQIFVQQIIDRDFAFLLDGATAIDDAGLVQGDCGQPVVHRQLFCVRRAAMERAWASKPSASARVNASGPMAAMLLASNPRMVVRFRKSSTD